ncbi:hypothetical protein ACTOJ1_000104 [Shigella flexneri]|mgnify:CR=1 FL=1
MNKITLHHIDGFIWSYKDLNDAYEKLGKSFIYRKVGFQFDYYVPEWKPSVYRIVTGYKHIHADFILRDDAGKELTSDDFLEFSNYQYDYKKRYIVRGTGPVPNLRRRGYCKYFRKPRTIQERRYNSSPEIFEYDDLIIKVKMRARRSSKNLPSSWDDIYRSNYKNNSWKKYRKQQWKDN